MKNVVWYENKQNNWTNKKKSAAIQAQKHKKKWLCKYTKEFMFVSL